MTLQRAMRTRRESFRSRDWRRGMWIALVLAVFAGSLHASFADQINVPFGLKWGLSKKQIQRLTSDQSIKIVDKQPVDEREAWTLEGFTQDNLDRTVVYFDTKGRMNEVELQYREPQWTPEKYDGQMIYFKRNFERLYGTGRTIVHSKTKEGTATISIEGYEWRTTSVILRLIHFAARRKAENYNNISVHYRSSL